MEMKFLVVMRINGKIEIKVVSYVPAGAQVMALWREYESAD